MVNYPSCIYAVLLVEAGTYCDTGMVSAIPGQIRCCVTVPNRLDVEAGEFHHFIQGMFSRPGAIGEHRGFFVANDNMSLCKREAIVMRTGLDCSFFFYFLSFFLFFERVKQLPACHRDIKAR